MFVWVWHVCRGVKKKRGSGLGFLSRVSLQPRSGVSFPPSPSLRAAGPRSGNKKKDSITGRWNPKWPGLPPCVCPCVCLRGSHPYLSYILNLNVLCVFACLLHPSKHTLPWRPTTSRHTHPKPPNVWSVFQEPLLCQQPTFCALADGESELESTLPPTGYCRQLQALERQFPYQPSSESDWKSLGTEM